MPIRIDSDGESASIWLCDDDWELPVQIAALETWLNQNRHALKADRYVADVGYSTRDGASGGGAYISTKMLKRLLEAKMELALSEYGPFVEGNSE